MIFNIFKCFQLRTIKDSLENEHLLLFSGYFYEELSISELENIKLIIQNTINNHASVDEYVKRENKIISDDLHSSPDYRPKKEKKKTPGFVYLAKCHHTGFFKIGFSKKVNVRIKQLQTANSNIELFKDYAVDDSLVEKELHKKYTELNVNKEWFNLSEYHLFEIDNFLNPKP